MTAAAGLNRTPLNDRHLGLGAKMVDFAGWEMPLNYPSGVVAEHLATRHRAGLFDVSHMGRFLVSGPGATAFLAYVLTNDATRLQVDSSHYTLLATETGGALDDAYLYRFTEGEYILVVNASNRENDWSYLNAQADAFAAAGSHGRPRLEDLTTQMAMISLQGPKSADIVAGLLESGSLPEPRRNALSSANLAGGEVRLARTGYTGEPVCFELLTASSRVSPLWDQLIARGAAPCGLGARDTLRLEAALPLYGHEQGVDPEGREIPVLSCPVTAFGVNLAPERDDFVGREALLRQDAALRALKARDYSLIAHLPRLIYPVAVTGRGIARAGSQVKKDGRLVGWVTSGTMVPYWNMTGEGPDALPTDRHDLRSICLAYLDSRLVPGDAVVIDVRGKDVEAVLVPRHLRSDMPPYARAVVYGR